MTTAPPQGAQVFYPRGAALEALKCKVDEFMVDGPAGCVAGETRLYNPLTGEHTPIAELYRLQIAPIVQTTLGPIQATVPFIKGKAKLYRLRFESGRECVVTADHLLFSPSGWRYSMHLSPGQKLRVDGPCPPPTSSASGLSVSLPSAASWRRKAQGSQVGYRRVVRSCGEQPQSFSERGPTSVPSHNDVPVHSRVGLPVGAPAYAAGHNRFCPSCARRATRGYSLQLGEMGYEGCCALSGTWQQADVSCQCAAQSPTGIHPELPTHAPVQRCGSTHRSLSYATAPLPFSVHTAPAEATRPPARQLLAGRLVADEGQGFAPADPALRALFPSYASSKLHYTGQWDTLASVEYVRTDVYYDLHVPYAEHYLAEGIWHHNTGKSRVLLEKLDIMARKYAGCRLAIVRKFRATLTETALVTFEQHVKPACDIHNQQRRVRQSYSYPNGSEIVVAGIDNPVKLMSAEFDAIYVQEATELTLNDWEFLSTRLRNGVIPYQQLFGDCNPGPPTHWLKKRMDAGLTRRILSRHADNPRLFDKAGKLTEFGRSYLARLDKLTGPRKARLKDGVWAAAEGMVFESWNEALHLIDPREIPADWRRFVVVDFGFTNPFVCQWWAIDPDGRMYRYREIYKTRRTVRDHAAQIGSLSAGEKIEAWVCDHDAEDRATLEQELSIRTIAADKAVSKGIQDVEGRLKPAEDGRPRLFLFKGALVERDPLLIDEETGLSDKPTCTEEEVDGYIWAKVAGKETLKESPVKENDHGCDAMRYAARYAEGAGKKKFVGWAS